MKYRDSQQICARDVIKTRSIEQTCAQKVPVRKVFVARYVTDCYISVMNDSTGKFEPQGWIEEKAPNWTAERPVYILRPPTVAELLAEADEEPNYVELSDYRPVIDRLRAKGFSYREVARWLTGRGIEVSYGTVYRLCTRGLPDDEKDIAAEELHQEEEDETHRNGF